MVGAWVLVGCKEFMKIWEGEREEVILLGRGEFLGLYYCLQGGCGCIVLANCQEWAGSLAAHLMR